MTEYYILFDFLTLLVLNGEVLEILKYKAGGEIDRTLQQTGLITETL